MILEALVTTLHANASEVRAEIRIEQRSAAKYGVRGAILTALRPWLGDALLKRGVLVYMHHAGRVEVATKGTTLDDIAEAETVEVVLQAEVHLPSTSAARTASRRTSQASEEREPMFNGFSTLDDGELF